MREEILRELRELNLASDLERLPLELAGQHNIVALSKAVCLRYVSVPVTVGPSLWLGTSQHPSHLSFSNCLVLLPAEIREHQRRRSLSVFLQHHSRPLAVAWSSLLRVSLLASSEHHQPPYPSLAFSLHELELTCLQLALKFLGPVMTLSRRDLASQLQGCRWRCTGWLNSS